MSMTNVLIIRKPVGASKEDEETIAKALTDYELGKPVVITNDMDAIVVPGPNHISYGLSNGYFWPVQPHVGGYGY